MEINKLNLSSYSSVTGNVTDITATDRNRLQFTSTSKNIVSGGPKDFLLLNPPVSETVYQRKEFVTDDSMAEGCAYCYTYMEKTIKFADGGTFSIISDRSDGYWCINMDTSSRTFGKSGADMNDISHAVEETWERRELSVSRSTLTGSMSDTVVGDYYTVAGSLDFAAESTAVRYSSASYTKGTVAYKNGGVKAYGEGTMSTREMYNRCAVFIAGAFGEKTSDLILSDRDFNDLFGNLTYGKKDPSKNEAAKNQLAKLREYMESRLSEVRRKKPGSSSLKIFADTCHRLEANKYSDITALITKIFDV